MNKLTFDQIKKILESELFDTRQLRPKAWMFGDIDDDSTNIKDETVRLEFEKLGKFEEVKHHGGEGQGDSYYSVYHFVDHDVYIQFDGWWVSHDGADYNEMFEVRPEQVTITQYQHV